jgi:hypothetical protein
MWCMGRGRGASSMEGEEDIISRENEVEEHEMRGEVCPFTMLWLAPFTPSPVHRFPTLTATTTRLRSRFGSNVTTPTSNSCLAPPTCRS